MLTSEMELIKKAYIQSEGSLEGLKDYYGFVCVPEVGISHWRWDNSEQEGDKDHQAIGEEVVEFCGGLERVVGKNRNAHEFFDYEGFSRALYLTGEMMVENVEVDGVTRTVVFLHRRRLWQEYRLKAEWEY